MTDFMGVTVQKRDWLNDGLEHAEKTFRLTREGRVPESIQGWMIVTACMRVLRAVYGDDLSTAVAIRDRVIAEEERLVREQKQ